MTHPLYTETEARVRESFLVLMHALSFPGRPQNLPAAQADDAFLLMAEALLDLETTCFTADMALDGLLAQTGARRADLASADYAFFPVLTDEHAASLALAKTGTLLLPDTSATLFIGCQFGGSQASRWTGPGIDNEITVRLSGLPDVFWRQREKAVSYPLGWDVFLVDGQQVIGLPRSTRVEPAAG
ncbi:MAG: phosphonate C-P lyase system protein PhnH [Pleurocapsa minor GSE-CHR-MK-17-07R]|nr:phosphonate C-P lyase system protein PhnH [Pleurocapsa minor GSE-CHR-MK 17-07R]